MIRLLGGITVILPIILMLFFGVWAESNVINVYEDFGAALPPISALAYKLYPYTILFLVLVLPQISLLNAKPAWGSRSFMLKTISVFLHSIYLLCILMISAGLYLPYYNLSQVG